MKRFKNITKVVVLIMMLFSFYFIYQVYQPASNDIPTFKETTTLLMLVNQNYPVEEINVNLKKYRGIQVNEIILFDLEQMIQAASQNKIKLVMNNCYRSKIDQSKIYNQKIEQYLNLGYDYEQSVVLTEETTMKPGYSEHETGLAIDFSGSSNDEIMWKWLKDNAYKYGFILRYPEEKEAITKINFEPWHYRYVGREYAKIITAAGLCLEEYLNKQ